MDKKALIKALRDTAQSASNTIASGVSAPVDLIAAGLRKMGVPVPENALGGSRWMEDVGLTIPVQEGIPKTVGETFGMIFPMAATAKAPQIAAGANRAIENAMAPATLNTPGFAGQRGAIVWHGSPQILESVNPTGNVFTKYTPELRANALLGKNITTLDKTMKAHPDEFITIYRGAPKNQLQINAGDFVTDNLQLAKDYAGTGHVIKKQVKLKDVLDDITEPLGSEYIYKPSK
jgi:hypothetical protein